MMVEVHVAARAQCFRLAFNRPLASFELVELLRQAEGAEDAVFLAHRLNSFAREHGVDLASLQPAGTDGAASAYEFRNRFL